MKLVTNRLVAAASDGDIWTVAPGRYTIERWDPVTGFRKQSISVKSTWFREIMTWPDDERQRPPAVIESIWADESGLVWLLIRDADLEWQAPARANIERIIHADEVRANVRLGH